MAWTHILRQPSAGWAACTDLLFPPRCPLCGRDSQAALCEPCARDLRRDAGRCLRCGGAHRGGGCRPLRACDGLAVLGGYDDPLRGAVLRCKRPSGEGLSRALADLLVDVHEPTLASWEIACVAAVPMHWRRRWMRGTSAADELAAGVARRLRRPCRRLLRRRVATRMQNELPPAERPANVRAAFAACRAVPGARVLLVDDVCTTGATLSACAATLKTAGAAAVYAVAVARAEPGHADTAQEHRGAFDD
jgi:ComF family protein